VRCRTASTVPPNSIRAAKTPIPPFIYPLPLAKLVTSLL
jgi:hypothetical protein